MRGCGRRGAECRDRCPRRLALSGLEGEAQQQPPPKAEENCRETGNGRSTHIRPPLPLGAVDAAPRLRAGPALARAVPGFHGLSGKLGNARLRPANGPRRAAGRGVRHFGTVWPSLGILGQPVRVCGRVAVARTHFCQLHGEIPERLLLCDNYISHSCSIRSCYNLCLREILSQKETAGDVAKLECWPGCTPWGSTPSLSQPAQVAHQ